MDKTRYMSRKRVSYIRSIKQIVLETFSQLEIVAFGMLTVFGSTHICEQTLLNMSFIKNKLRR